MVKSNRKLIIAIILILAFFSFISLNSIGEEINKDLICEPESETVCTTIKDCPGIKSCSSDGLIISECIDIPEDNCPLQSEQICDPETKDNCETDDNCPGVTTCSQDGNYWEVCKDIPDDECPETTICEPKSILECTTNEGCIGKKTCNLDGTFYGDCKDIPDDGCPDIIEKFCEPQTAIECITSDNCEGRKRCNQDGSGYGDCIDRPDDNCPLLPPKEFRITRAVTSSCPQPIRNLIEWEVPIGAINYEIYYCTNSECNPTTFLTTTPDTEYIHNNVEIDKVYSYRVIAKNEDGVFTSSYNDVRIKTLDCLDQICNPGDTESQPCTDLNNNEGFLFVRCNSEGSNWEPRSECKIIIQTDSSTEKDEIIDDEQHTVIEEVFNFDDQDELEKKEIYELIDSDNIEIDDNDKELIKELISEIEELEKRSREKEEEIIKKIEGVIKEGTEDEIEEIKKELKNIQKDKINHKIKNKVYTVVKEISIDEIKKKPLLIKELRREYINKARNEPDRILKHIIEDQELNNVLIVVNEKIIVKDNVEDIFNKFEENTITLGLINRELELKETEIEESIDIQKNLEEFKKSYELAKNNVKIKKVANSIKDEDEETGEIGDVTLVTLFIETDKILNDFTIYEKIPKEIAADLSNIIFYDQNFEIIESDPLIAWHFATLTSDIEISYGILNEINTEDLEKTSTIPIVGKVIEKDVGFISNNYLFKIIFPVFMIFLIIFIVLFFHKFGAVKEEK